MIRYLSLLMIVLHFIKLHGIIVRGHVGIDATVECEPSSLYAE
jgi:hypothetical protein